MQGGHEIFSRHEHGFSRERRAGWGGCKAAAGEKRMLKPRDPADRWLGQRALVMAAAASTMHSHTAVSSASRQRCQRADGSLP